MSIKSKCNCNANKCNCLTEKDDTESYISGSTNIETISFTETAESTQSSYKDTSIKEYICINCNTSFKNKQTLNLHKKTVKCNVLNKDDNETKKICEFCDKKFASKQMKNYHQNNCIEKIKYEMNLTHQNEIKNLIEKYTIEISNLKISFQTEIEKLKK
jgi:hypothetical protein